MLTINLTEWSKRIVQAINKANEERCPIIISDVIRLNEGDPFRFFHRSKDKYDGERFYWRDPNRNLTISGSGVAYRINHPAQKNRYSTLESEWLELLNSSLLFGEKVEGTGPILFGGFSFDPLQQKTALWSQFCDTHFHLPSYVLTKREEGIYLTINMVVQPDTKVVTSKLPDVEFLTEALSILEEVQLNSTHLTSMKDIKGEEWMDCVKQATDRMKKGEFEKVVLAREVQASFVRKVSIEATLHELITKENNSFIFVLEANEHCFIGATPERLVRKEGMKLLSTCLAGSTPRGKTNAEDEMLGNTLLQDSKNRKEHQIVVNMIKDALASECTRLEIPEVPVLMKLKHIQHLYTPVSGIAKEDVSILRLVERLHPTPALGGWPKEKSMAVIREIEPLDRGLYGGPLGWMDGSGNGEFVVAIRSALIQGQEVSLFAGCGIVEESNPEAELQETRVKIKPMLTALGGE